MSAKGAQDDACSFSHVQDLKQTLGANAVQTVQDFRLAFVGIVVLVADLTFCFLWWGAVLLTVCLCTSHLQVMFWGGKYKEMRSGEAGCCYLFFSSIAFAAKSVTSLRCSTVVYSTTQTMLT